MARELVEVIKREIAEAETRLMWLKETLRKAAGMEAQVPAGVLTVEGKLIRPSTTTAKAADAIERLLERGAKTMKRETLIKALVEQKLVGKDGITDKRRHQYAEFAIEAGLEAETPYLKEDRDGTIHWIPGARKSRVSKRR
jgi:hypothetical protein